MRALIIALAVVLALVVIAKADTESTTAKDTFFGVDRSDEHAVREKHRELADEQYKKMFGEDHPLPDFFETEPGTEAEAEPKKFSEMIREAVKKLGDLFKSPEHSTTEAPQPME